MVLLVKPAFTASAHICAPPPVLDSFTESCQALLSSECHKCPASGPQWKTQLSLFNPHTHPSVVCPQELGHFIMNTHTHTSDVEN